MQIIKIAAIFSAGLAVAASAAGLRHQDIARRRAAAGRRRRSA